MADTNATPKTYGISLHDTMGARMRVYAQLNRKNGTYVVRVRHTVRDKAGNWIHKMSPKEVQTTFASAETRVKAIADSAVKGGWTAGAARSGGFGSRVDFDFNALPKPNTVQSFAKAKEAKDAKAKK